jgi:hypothetical protein
MSMVLPRPSGNPASAWFVSRKLLYRELAEGERLRTLVNNLPPTLSAPLKPFPPEPVNPCFAKGAAIGPQGSGDSALRYRTTGLR